MTQHEKGIREFVPLRYWQCEGKTLIACNFFSSVFLRTKRCLTLKTYHLKKRLSCQISMGILISSSVQEQEIFPVWIYGFVFQFSLNIVNGSLISYSNDNGNYVEEYAFEAKRSMANNNV